jgi:AraC-like DNA-binding protein
MTSNRITWSSESPGRAPARVVRHRLGDRGMGFHRHEFIEVFWCESGSAVHQVNGAELPIGPGDVVCMRADDEHGYARCRGFTMVNISFMAAPIAPLASRAAEGWPWQPGPLPLMRNLGPAAMERLAAWTGDLAQPGAGPHELDAFLFDLVRLWSSASGPAESVPPPWLRDACSAFTDPAHLPGGTTALCRLAGRGAAHLNRQIRRWHDCTASELVARLRLDWAARELRLSGKPISTIAADCGMPHLGHFYRRFQGRFGTTPRRWRLDAWRAIER